MVSSNRTTLTVMIGFLGALALSATTAVISWNYCSEAAQSFTDFEAREFERFALEEFINSEPMASISTQRGLIRFAQLRWEMGWLEDDFYRNMVGMAKARNAVSFSELGDESKAETALQEAIQMLTVLRTPLSKRDLFDSTRSYRRENQKLGNDDN